MAKQEYKTGKIPVVEERSPILYLAKGIAMACAITLVVFIVYALLLTHTSLSEEGIPLVVIITSIVSVLVAGFDAARGAKSKGWIWGMGAGVLYAVILLIISTVVAKEFVMDQGKITLMICAIGAGGLGGMIGINVKK